MNHLTIAAIVCGACILTEPKVFADSLVAPEDYIESVTSRSERIVLIDVKAVKVKTIKIDKGIETREVTVEANRVETLRGNDKDQEFQDTSESEIVSDMAEAKKNYPLETIRWTLWLHPVHRPASCKPGHRYLAMFWGKAKFFVEVPKDSDEWRKQVQDLREWITENNAQQVMTHQPAISFSNSFHSHFNRAGGRTSNVLPNNHGQDLPIPFLPR